METKTIEERAVIYSQKCEYLNGDTCHVQKECRKWGYQIGAQEQDKIARQEERERCIHAVMNALCGHCHLYNENKCMHNELIGNIPTCYNKLMKIIDNINKEDKK